MSADITGIFAFRTDQCDHVGCFLQMGLDGLIYCERCNEEVLLDEDAPNTDGNRAAEQKEN